MTTEVKVPALGETVTTMRIVRWHHSDGQIVHAGDELLDVENDKALTTVHAEVAGTLRTIFLAGVEILPGDVVAHIDASPGHSIDERHHALAHAKLNQTAAAQCEGSRQFVVGTQSEGFCSILAEEGETADDQDLTFARRFDTLDAAFAVAWETGRSVFEVIEVGGLERLEEVLIDAEDEGQ